MKQPLGCLAVIAALLLALPTARVEAQTAPPGYHLLDAARQGQYLQLGSRGPAVAVLQVSLSRVGFPLLADGAFGPLTRAAVQGFQYQRGLAADGVVGPATLSALDAALGLTGGGAPALNPGTGTPAGGIPARPAGAMTGSEFIAYTTGGSTAQRESAILNELLSGNIPDFLRTLRPVTVHRSGHTIVYRVMPDYLAIGTDSDYLRIPMGARTAQAIADAYGCSLPTRRMVTDIWAAATQKLTPIAMTPGAQMRSNAYFLAHNQSIEAQLRARSHSLGELVGGHKKDVVLTDLYIYRPDRVAIFGWHYPNGTYIQPLSTVHVHWYADYSHGIRLIEAVVEVDGRAMDLVDVMSDPSLHPLVSDEGVITQTRVP